MYDRKKLTVLRAVLIAVGGALGGTALWQYFVYYPDVMRREIQIVVIVVSAIAAAALFGVSAKAFYRFGASIAALYAARFAALGVRGGVAVGAGLFTAGMLAYLFDVALGDYLGILPVRVLADILVALGVAALCCYGFSKWLTAEEGESEKAANAAMPRGYLLTASCFFDDRVYVAAESLLNVKVSENAAKALWKSCEKVDAAALERLRAVTADGRVEVIKSNAEFESAEEYCRVEGELAARKRLKVIEADSQCFAKISDAMQLAVFAPPKGESAETADGAL